MVNTPGSTSPTIRILIKTVVKPEGKPEEEKEEVIDIPSKGVIAEQESFFDAINGNDDGLKFGDPFGTLEDVAFIQAALNSNGKLVDLTKLVGGVEE